MPAGLATVLFVAGVVVSLAASWLLVSRLERLAERAGFSEAWLGLVAALAADAPEITSAVTALSRGQASVGAGVVIGSNVFNLAALLGVAAVVAGRIVFHRRVVLLAGVPGVWVALVCLLAVAGVVSPAAGLALAAVVLVPYGAVLGMRRARMERLKLPRRWVRWLVTSVHEEETELAGVVRPHRGTWRDAAVAVAALVVVVAASTTMEIAATAVGVRYAVADIVTGGLVLAVVTSLPNAVSAVYLARRGRGAAVLSTALNSNAINVVAGLLIPAWVAGLGPRTGQGMLVAGWYAGLTVLALGFSYRGGGLARIPGAVIIAGYAALVAAVLISVAQSGVRPATVIIPGAAIAAAGALALRWPSGRPGHRPPALRACWWQQDSALPGWSIGRLWKLSLILCGLVAVSDTATGSHLVLIGLLAVGPCCALLTARWPLTAGASFFALALGLLLGIPDQIFGTIIQYAFLAAVAAVSAAATIGTAVLQHHRP
jgi:cation:H+ antiporter